MLSRFLHGIMARTQTVAVLRELADAATVPVANGEAGDWDHPSQSVSDALTIFECGGRLEGETMAWLGHGDCTCNSVALTFSRLGRKGMVMWAVSFSTMRPPAGRVR